MVGRPALSVRLWGDHPPQRVARDAASMASEEPSRRTGKLNTFGVANDRLS